uniref:G-protein coupled receptors family 1 profile domain-containing protein n=1 Tax=Romanomermis culicivorax TaxID=13658 RepID=A0A915I778_ROMCU
MDLSNSSNISNIDQLSLFMLSKQFPAYILNIVLAIMNIIGGTLFLIVKYKTGDYGTLQHCIINELLSSLWSLVSFANHLKNSVNLVSEVTTPFVCYQWVAGVIYFGTNTSILFMFIVSVERTLSVALPCFYKYSYGNFQRSVCIAAWMIMILLFGISFLDKFPTELIPICLARAAIGHYSFYFYSYFYLILSVSSSLIYIVTMIYLKKESAAYNLDHNRSNSNLADIRRKINDKVSLALMFAVFWHTVTNSVASVATVFIYKLPYRGALIGPYLGAFYYTGAMSFFVCHMIFVEDFRKHLFWLLFGRKPSNSTVTPIIGSM